MMLPMSKLMRLTIYAMILCLSLLIRSSDSFTSTSRHTVHRRFAPPSSTVRWETKNDNNKDALEDGVVELAIPEEKETPVQKQPQQVSFISQGEIDPSTLQPDMSDPKQARVIFYIILSLVPVLFLIPLMLGSRELIPMDMLPAVDM